MSCMFLNNVVLEYQKQYCLNMHKANPNGMIRNCKAVTQMGDFNLLLYKQVRQLVRKWKI